RQTESGDEAPSTMSRKPPPPTKFLSATPRDSRPATRNTPLTDSAVNHRATIATMKLGLFCSFIVTMVTSKEASLSVGGRLTVHFSTCDDTSLDPPAGG
uniref:Uncharacterized protein n=1 Tax=Paramormyrops kingsleyae TaxID=1676925 RepID=A0A3B3QN41_9TELE